MPNGLHVDRYDFPRGPRRKFEPLFADAAPAIHGNDRDGRRLQGGRYYWRAAGGGYSHGVIVPPDRAEKHDQERDKEQGDPGAFNKLRKQHHDDGDTRYASAQAIHQRAFPPVRTAIFSPVHHHAELRERESQKCTYRVKGDQFVGDAAEKDEQGAREYGQNDDSGSVDKSAAAKAEDVGEIVVQGDGAAQARKICKRRVRGQRKNQQDRADGHVIQNSFAEDRGDEHRENALVTRLPWKGRRDAVDFYEIRNSRQEHGQ